MTARRLRPVTLLLASGLILAACSDAGGTAGSATTPPNPPSTVPQAPGTTTTTTTIATPTTVTTPDDTGAPPSTPAVGGGGACPEELEEGTSSRLVGDLDGDGVFETVAVDRPSVGETTITVCDSPLAVAPYQVGDTNRPAEVYLVDIEGDGVSELLVGGATGAAARFVGSVVRLEGSELTDLQLDLSVFPGGRTGSSFGCVDVDGDGLRELVTLTYEFDADTAEAATTVAWTRTVVLDDQGAVGATATGTFDTATQPRAVAALVNGTCGEETLIEVF